MPEGDTVWLAGRRLDAALGGKVLTGCDFRVPQLATTDLTGSTVSSVRSVGKHLLTRFVGGPGDGLSLHTHFMMDGSWHLYPDGERWRGGADHQVRAVLRVEGLTVVGYRLPVMELVPTADEDTVVGHIGPDLLGEDWDATEAVRRLAADPGRMIGDALLDQRLLAGLGNLYRAETCFLCGVTPFTPVGRLREHGTSLERVVAVGWKLLQINKDRVLQSTTGDSRRGRHHWVFEQRHCLRCGTRTHTATTGVPPRERIAWWCPRCQKGPAPASVPVREILPPTTGRTKYRP